MANTSQLLLPIPDLTQSADGPDAFQKGLQGVEDFFYTRTISTSQQANGVNRTPAYYWGSVTALPSGTAVRAGDTAWYATYNVMVMFNGTDWRQCRIPTVSSTDATPGFYTGQLRDHPTLGLQRWNGPGWGPANLGTPWARITGTNAAFNVAAGTSEVMWGVTSSYLDTIVKNWNMDVTTQPGAIKVVTAGWYRVFCVMAFVIPSGTGRRAASVGQNRVINNQTQGGYYSTSANGMQANSAQILLAANAGDLFTPFYYHEGATPRLDLTGSVLQVEWVAPL